jgi:hypothetical protein
MTLVKIPKGTLLHITNSANSSETRTSADISVDAALLAPITVRIGTVDRATGALRELKSEPSAFVRQTLHQRYGCSSLHDLFNAGVTTQVESAIMVETQPWMAWWKKGHETCYVELAGPIDQYVDAVMIGADAVVETDPRTLEIITGDDRVKVLKRDVLASAPDTMSSQGGVMLKLERTDAARYGWTA